MVDLSGNYFIMIKDFSWEKNSFQRCPQTQIAHLELQLNAGTLTLGTVSQMSLLFFFFLVNNIAPLVPQLTNI